MTQTAGNGDAVLAAERHELLDGQDVGLRDRPAAWRGRLHRIAILLVALNVVLVSLLTGLRLRQWMWIHTDSPQGSLRFDFDIENAHKWGTEVLRRATANAAGDPHGGKATDWRHFWPAYVGLYDYVVKEHPDGEYGLDYTPTRLLIAALWVRHEHLVYPHVPNWQRPYDYTAPLLRLNTVCELLAAIGAFLLVRHWVWRGTLPARPLFRRRQTQSLMAESPPVPSRAWVLGLVAAVLIWFCPAILFDAHVFPQWDVWLLPSFFFAAWLASNDWWFTAGLLIPFGILMKGQLTMVTPFFILWPLIEGKPMAAVRLVLGCALAGTLTLSPWLVNGPTQWAAVCVVAVVAIAVFAALTFPKPNLNGTTWLMLRLGSAAAIVLCFLWIFGWWVHSRVTHAPFKIRPVEVSIIVGLLIVQALLYRSDRIFRRQSAALLASAVISLSVIFAAAFFGGSMSWHKVSFDYPTHHWRMLSIGESDNLGMILANAPFLWRLDEPMFSWHLPFSHAQHVVTIKALLIAIYTVTLVLCSIGAAVKSRRNDPAFLIALTAPWLLLFALLPQMHERYLLWAAAVSAITVAVSFPWALMHLVLAVLSTSMILRLLLEFGQNRARAPGLSRVLISMHPGAAWAVLLCAGIFLYFAIAPHRRTWALGGRGSGRAESFD